MLHWSWSYIKTWCVIIYGIVSKTRTRRPQALWENSTFMSRPLFSAADLAIHCALWATQTCILTTHMDLLTLPILQKWIPKAILVLTGQPYSGRPFFIDELCCFFLRWSCQPVGCLVVRLNAALNSGSSSQDRPPGQTTSRWSLFLTMFWNFTLLFITAKNDRIVRGIKKIEDANSIQTLRLSVRFVKAFSPPIYLFSHFLKSSTINRQHNIYSGKDVTSEHLRGVSLMFFPLLSIPSSSYTFNPREWRYYIFASWGFVYEISQWNISTARC